MDHSPQGWLPEIGDRDDIQYEHWVRWGWQTEQAGEETVYLAVCGARCARPADDDPDPERPDLDRCPECSLSAWW